MNAAADGNPPAETTKKGLWGRLRSGLGRTRNQLAAGMGNLLLGEKEIDEAALEELETALLLTDVGMETTREIMGQLTARVRRKELNDTRTLYDALSDLLTEQLVPFARPFEVPAGTRPFVVFFVGVVDFFECNQFQIAVQVEVTLAVPNVGNPAGHSGGKVQSDIT